LSASEIGNNSYAAKSVDAPILKHRDEEKPRHFMEQRTYPFGKGGRHFRLARWL
jgi:hypothetical protein